MAPLTTKARDKLPVNAFALPDSQTFPIQDASHARNAFSGAARAENAGNITPAEAATVRVKAAAKLDSLGKAKARAVGGKKKPKGKKK
jgi:hypothetical protein